MPIHDSGNRAHAKSDVRSCISKVKVAVVRWVGVTASGLIGGVFLFKSIVFEGLNVDVRSIHGSGQKLREEENLRG